MFDAGEIGKPLAHVLLLGSRAQSCKRRRHAVAHVVLTLQADVVEINADALAHLERDAFAADERAACGVLSVAEAQLAALGLQVLQLAADVLVLLPVDECVRGVLVLQYAHLRVHVVLHLEVVAVEVVGRDVQQYGNVGAEVVHVVKLEGRKLYHVPVLVVLRHLQGETSSDVSCQPHVEAGFFHDVVDERRRRGLAVAACDAHGARLRVASRELYLAEDGSALRAELAHHRHRLGNAWALHHLIGIEYEALRMSALLPRYVVGVEDGFVVFLYLSIVGDEDVVAFLLSEHGGSDAALGGS